MGRWGPWMFAWSIACQAEAPNDPDGSLADADTSVADAADVDQGSDAPGRELGGACPDDALVWADGRAIAVADTWGADDTIALSCVNDGPDVVYSFAAPFTGPFFVSVAGSYDAAVAVRQGCSPDHAELGCSDDAVQLDPGVLFDARAGVEYLVIIDGHDGASGPFEVTVLPGEVCDNGEDDDGDGRIDCADPKCSFDRACREISCSDGEDDDGDGLIDCADLDCASDRSCREFDCADDDDNDGDGERDCRDQDCDPALGPADPACVDVCGNGIDDDADGRSDCQERRCGTPCEVSCDNGTDDDGDGFVDCEDDECLDRLTAPHCLERDCDDATDDDLDGYTDCDDSDCFVRSECCIARCPSIDLGTRLGPEVATGQVRGCQGLYANSCFGSGFVVEVGHRFTAERAGLYELDNIGSNLPAHIAVFDADACDRADALRMIGCAEAMPPESFATRVRVWLGADQSVLVMVGLNTLWDPGLEPRYMLNIRRL